MRLDALATDDPEEAVTYVARLVAGPLEDDDTTGPVMDLRAVRLC